MDKANILDKSHKSNIDDTSITDDVRKWPKRPWVRVHYLSQEIVDEIDRLKEEWGLQSESELVRWLLGVAIDLVNAGKVEPTLTSVTTTKLE